MGAAGVGAAIYAALKLITFAFLVGPMQGILCALVVCLVLAGTVHAVVAAEVSKVERSVQALSAQDPWERRTAAEEVARIGEKALPALVRALDSGDPPLREGAAEALGLLRLKAEEDLRWLVDVQAVAGQFGAGAVEEAAERVALSFETLFEARRLLSDAGPGWAPASAAALLGLGLDVGLLADAKRALAEAAPSDPPAAGALRKARAAIEAFPPR